MHVAITAYKILIKSGSSQKGSSLIFLSLPFLCVTINVARETHRNQALLNALSPHLLFIIVDICRKRSWGLWVAIIACKNLKHAKVEQRKHEQLFSLSLPYFFLAIIVTRKVYKGPNFYKYVLFFLFFLCHHLKMRISLLSIFPSLPSKKHSYVSIATYKHYEVFFTIGIMITLHKPPQTPSPLIYSCWI